MKRTIVKSFMLFVLIIISFYQTSMLWFDELSNRNFFYSINDYSDTATNKIEQSNVSLISPTDVALYFNDANKEFIALKRNLDYDTLYAETLKILRNSLKIEKSFSDINAEELWTNRGIFIKLSFPLGLDQIYQDLGVQVPSNLPTIKVDQLVICPAYDLQKSSLSVYFVDETNKVIKGMEVNKSVVQESNNILISYIELYQDKTSGISISTARDSIPYFMKNVFVPISSGNEYFNTEITLRKSFIKADTIETAAFERYANNYFVNPDVKSVLKKESSIKYYDEKISVQYNKNGVLEYTNSTYNSNRTKAGLLDALSIANQFYSKDSLIGQQEYYLEGYTAENNETTFYYRYAMFGLPLSLSSEILRGSDMAYPLEVTVANGVVKRYRRLVLENQAIQDQGVPVPFSLEEALDRFVSMYRESYDKDPQIDDMFLGYYWDAPENMLKLKWIVIEGDKTFNLELNKPVE